MLKNKFHGTRNKKNMALIMQYYLFYAVQLFRRILQLCIAQPFDQLRSRNSLIPTNVNQTNGAAVMLFIRSWNFEKKLMHVSSNVEAVPKNQYSRTGAYLVKSLIRTTCRCFFGHNMTSLTHVTTIQGLWTTYGRNKS